jgi:hypothetical protein
MNNHLHIISFDVPYPANYGGVIDVFYKLKNLSKKGIGIYLHCFEYGRGKQPELLKYCEKVFYYKRNTSFLNHLNKLPFIIKSRMSEELIANLSLDNYPILFEGLHTCGILYNPKLKDRYKIYRESNIEHHYYQHLAKAEKSNWKKMYFLREAKKLAAFEKQLIHCNVMLKREIYTLKT